MTQNFPTPAEAFGRSQQQQNQRRSSGNSTPSSTSGHTQYATSQHSSQSLNSRVLSGPPRPVRQHPNARPSTGNLRDQYTQPQQFPPVPQPRSSRMNPPQDGYNSPMYSSQSYGSPQSNMGHTTQRLPPPQQQQPQQSAAQILERQLRDIFDRVDRDRDGRLTADELATALLNNDGTQFQSSTIGLMIRLFDTDGSSTIEFREFYHLWNYLLHWRKTFQRFDQDQNGKISFGEYQTALETFGYKLPTDIVLFVFQKFGDFNHSKPMSLRFDMFVESLVWLLRCTNVFKKFDVQGNGIATIPFQDFVHEIISFI